MLYNEPDFVNVKSLLEIACEARGFRAIFFPKFHCELNFIEQCWGYSKRIYREFPASSKEADLEHNVLVALESIPLASIRW
jgi:transposase